MKATIRLKSGRAFSINNIVSIKSYSSVVDVSEETRDFCSFCIHTEEKYVFVGDSIFCVNGTEIECVSFE